VKSSTTARGYFSPLPSGSSICAAASDARALRLGIIDVAQRVGFTLDEIRELLSTGHGTADEQLRRLAERKLPEIEELIHRANAVRRWLEMTSACDCETLDVCSLFDDRVLGLEDQTKKAPWRQVVPAASP